MAPANSFPDQSDENSSKDHVTDPAARDIELLYVLVSRKGTRVDVQWALHPQLKHDLLPNEWSEVTDLMTKVTKIVGHRFSQVLSRAEATSPGQV
ncbi:MAG: hypothetical protein NZM29_01215 [Nitrospira sp.]|nr:hypothetical protein [Nitrospira sp.]